MSMHELPKIIIDGAVFAIDSNKKSLIDLLNNANSMDLEKNRGAFGYFLLYDKEKRNLADGMYKMPRDYDTLIQVGLPLDLTKMNGIPTDLEVKKINEEAIANGMNFVMVDSSLNERLAGKLPKIDIHGDSFTVDWRLKELRSDTYFNGLRFNDFDVSDDGERYEFFYHKPTQTLVFLTRDITELPKDTFLVEIENELILDSVATARQHALNDAAFYPKYPIIMQHQAKVIPIEETILAEIVEQNRKERDLEGRDGGTRQR